MAKWSTKTLLREILDFQRQKKLGDDAKLGDIIAELKEQLVTEEIEKSMRPTKPAPAAPKTDS